MTYIYSSKTNYIEFFIKIWKKCPTACTNCSYANSELDYFELDNIIKRIKYWQNLFIWKDFVYFLYWVDFLNHPQMFEILDCVKNTWRKFKIQIGLIDLEEKKELLEKIYNKYWFFEVTIADEVNTNDDIKLVLKSLAIFSKLKKIRFNFDIITDILKNKIFVSKLKQLFWNYRIDKVHKNLTFDDIWNINLWITDKFYMNAKDKLVTNIAYDKCIMDDLFDIKDDIVYFNDHLELDYKWYLMLHTPLCFLAYIKIAHIDDSNNIILEKFKKFKADVGKVNSDMSKKCFNCIINNYPV